MDKEKVDKKNKKALLIDIGNTRIKWATISKKAVTPDLLEPELLKKGSIIHDGHFSSLKIDDLPGVSEIDEVLISSVLTQESNENFKVAIKYKYPLAEINFFKSQKTAFGVTNAYESPETLGVDRWLGIIAARFDTSCEQGVIVIDCGTAITIDVADKNGKHLGGIISPGLATMRKSLNLATERLQLVDSGNVKPHCSNTIDAISSGTTLSLVGLIEHIINNTAGADQYSIFLTGGDANGLSKYLTTEHLTDRIIVEPDLLLKGLAHIYIADNS